MAGTIVAYGRWLAAWELGEDGGVCPVLCSGRNIGMQGKQKEHRWEPGTQPDRHSSKACKDREGVVSSQTARTARIMLAMPWAMGHGPWLALQTGCYLIATGSTATSRACKCLDLARRKHFQQSSVGVQGHRAQQPPARSYWTTAANGCRQHPLERYTGPLVTPLLHLGTQARRCRCRASRQRQRRRRQDLEI